MSIPTTRLGRTGLNVSRLALGTMTFANLPETGLLLDATPWMALPFVEGETLHFKPVKA